jgi:DGQHR domain-containing protein
MNRKQEDRTALIDVIAIRTNQHGKSLYLFSLKASTIHDLVSTGRLVVDKWKPNNPNGYQRDPVDSRYKNFGKFVAKKKGTSPLSILLSLRDRNAMHIRALPGSSSVYALKIMDTGNNNLYIPDGQHRTYGIDWAYNEYPGELDDYETPVVLMISDSSDPRFEEAQNFYLINNNSKRTKTDLAQRYILNEREKGAGDITSEITVPSGSAKELAPYAVKIVDMLNEEGPFKERIIYPNVKSSTASISQSSFIDSMKPFLDKASEAHWTIGKTTAVLNGFWNAVKSKCPNSFDHWSGDACLPEDPRHFKAVLTTTSGVYVLNAILAKVLLLPGVLEAPTAPETYKAILGKKQVEKYFVDGPEGYWSSEQGVDGAASHGTSRKAFKDIIEGIWDDLAEEQTREESIGE